MLVTSENTKRNMEIRYNKGMKVNTTVYIYLAGEGFFGLLCFFLSLLACVDDLLTGARHQIISAGHWVVC